MHIMHNFETEDIGNAVVDMLSMLTEIHAHDKSGEEVAQGFYLDDTDRNNIRVVLDNGQVFAIRIISEVS